ncbi:unnamed protein product, partial [Didymodactylos carnosus]
MLRTKSSLVQYVPLKFITISSKICAFAADVCIQQIFENSDEKPIEAVYCFSMEENGAVYSFIAQLDERKIVAQLKEKCEAQQQYSQAIQQGHGAYLLEQDEKSNDIFVVNVGALLPKKQCQIDIRYVTELEL